MSEPHYSAQDVEQAAKFGASLFEASGRFWCCPKCGDVPDGMDLTYIPASRDLGPEHLAVACPTCGYARPARCVDHKEES